MTTTVTLIEQGPCVFWYEIRGTDPNTRWQFDDGDVYGVTLNGDLVDENGYALEARDNGDSLVEAVRNALNAETQQ